MPEQSEESELYLQLLAAIDDHYQPANTVQDAELFLTTKQIVESLSGMHTGIDIAAMGDFMLQTGFKFDKVGDMEFAWLLQERKIKPH